MVRHKEFDPDEAVADAMALFWERGYEATERLRRHLDVSREVLDAQIRRGQQDGSVTDRIDPGMLTAVAFNAWLGFRVAVRARTPHDQIIHDVEQLLSLLNGSRS